MLETIQRESVISFPMLGDLRLNPPSYFMLFGHPIYFYGVLIGLGFLLGIAFCAKRAKRFGLKEDDIYDVMIWLIPCSIIGARAYYVLFQLGYYVQHPDEIFALRNGGLAIYGGVIGAVLAVVIFTKVTKIRTAAMLDVGGLGLMIGQSIGRWGNFINREAHGGLTDSFLRMGLTDGAGATVYVHPTFLYESLWNILGFVILHFYSKRRKYDGQIFVMYLGWYGLGRMFIEGLRTDSLYLGSTNLRVSQLLAGLCVVFAVFFLFYNKVFREHEPEELYVNRPKEELEETSEDTSEEPAAESAEETAEIDPEEPEETPEEAPSEAAEEILSDDPEDAPETDETAVGEPEE